jgi:hypothetical protein
MPGDPPESLLDQARYSASMGVALDVVLRRYSAGYALLTDYLIEEAQRDDVNSANELREALRRLTGLFDSLVATVTHEYTKTKRSEHSLVAAQRLARVGSLLAGELPHHGEFDYDFESWHLAALASGPLAARSLRDIAAKLDSRMLIVAGQDGWTWAWLGNRARCEARQVLAMARSNWPQEHPLALGEAGKGLGGWRRSHRQAAMAKIVATAGAPARVSYADSALLALALSDEVLRSTLYESFLAPLEREKDGGERSRRTLAAYFAAGRNASSAAAILGVHRKTVSLRLRAIEERLGRSFEGCSAELETAIRMAELS